MLRPVIEGTSLLADGTRKPGAADGAPYRQSSPALQRIALDLLVVKLATRSIRPVCQETTTTGREGWQS